MMIEEFLSNLWINDRPILTIKVDNEDDIDSGRLDSYLLPCDYNDLEDLTGRPHP